jgi:hypothetical protein
MGPQNIFLEVIFSTYLTMTSRLRGVFSDIPQITVFYQVHQKKGYLRGIPYDQHVARNILR